MKLSDQSVREFIKIYKAEFGSEIGYKQAEEMGSELLSFYQLVALRNP